MEDLKKQRKSLKLQITNFKKYMEGENQRENQQLKLRLEKALPLWDKFDTIQTSLEILDEKELEYRSEFENVYFQAIGKAKQELETIDHLNASVNTNTSVNNQIKVKLPTLNLPIFTGKYADWLMFKDSFHSIIDKNESLTDIQKLQYLRGALRNEALQIIQALETTDENYTTAWELLKSRYANEQLIINTHMKNLFELIAISKDSYINLRQFIDNIRTNISALKSLKEPVDNWSTVLIFLFNSKLDWRTRQQWQEKLSLGEKTEKPTLDTFLEFLSNKCQSLEMTEKSDSSNKVYSTKKNVYVTTREQIHKCQHCGEQHFLFKCDKFLKLTTTEKYAEVKRLKLCINCLKPGHYGRDCKSSTCKKCHKGHNTLLHEEIQENKRQVEKNTQSNTVTNFAQQRVEHHTITILPTVIVLVSDRFGKMHKVRAIIDSGSQSNFVTKKLTRKLGLTCNKTNISVCGINQKISTVSDKTQITIKSKHYDYTADIECLVLEKITDDLPQISMDKKTFNIPDDIELADDNFEITAPIDLLIGSEIFWEIICNEQIRSTKFSPTLQKTKFGWIVAGAIKLNSQLTNHTSLLSTNDSLQDQLERFWKIEEINERRQWTHEERECEEHFQRTATRNEEGRFIVRLPTKTQLELGDSYGGATKRFEALERRLSLNPEIKNQYLNFMQQYEQLQHMSQINTELDKIDKPIFYLPHHHVIKQDSLTTKLRVVFDGSFKSTTGTSLNHKLLVGPVIQEELFSIILRFRMHAYVITADIESMFRQILVKEEDRRMQRIVWREDSNQPLQKYTLNTVTYGTSCAPFLATRCLLELALQDGNEFTLAKEALLRDFYMDDVLTGTRTISEAIELQQQLTILLRKGKFELRKWRTNNEAILEKLSEETKTNKLLVLKEQEGLKTLGILWNSSTDTINYKLKLTCNNQVTKRTILGQIAQIFDPLGLIGPVTIKAKILMQTLWKQKIEWDEPIANDIYTDWIEYSKSLSAINNLQVERNVNPGNKEQQVDIHGFSDASTIAYGACIYATSIDNTGNRNTRLLCAKARVAPLKTISLPRLELCGAAILAKLMASVKQSLTNKIRRIYLWSDSTVVLAWLKTSPNLLKTFVANKVTEIQRQTTDATWQHVNSAENPADIISRGVSAAQLIRNQLWWNGPPWLQTNQWPEQTAMEETQLEMKTKVMLTTQQKNFDILNRYSSWSKLLRVIAYCTRFIHNTRKKNAKIHDEITSEELGRALEKIVLLIQEQCFSKERQDLQRKGSVDNKSKLLMLKPFLDDKGLIRVGGRLKNADISIDQKHPYILPSKHHVTDLIIKHEHCQLHHCGQEQLLSIIRLRFWPIAGRQAVRKIVRNCYQCFRYKPKPSEHLMGDLPRPRITEYSRPFTICGIDYAGPIQIRLHKRRGRVQINKAYIAIFVCFSTKAAHLELISDLTAEAFLAALRRFVARRGICKEIHSDNATNFVGASRKLKEMYEFLQGANNDISRELQNRGIKWQFIPPRAPHFGGLWEATVKATKRHLYTVTQTMLLTFEECATLLSEIEAVLNSRPIIPLSSSPNDLTPLTPSHFLIGDILVEPASYSYGNVPDNKLSRWQHLQKIKEHFWKRWRQEYLHHLQQRNRWQRSSPNIEPGTLVVLLEDNTPPLHWPMGRIIETSPGSDGVVRVVTVRTASGVYKRPVKRVCVLPTSE